jgi:SAM-dependent methyltransferase
MDGAATPIQDLVGRLEARAILMSVVRELVDADSVTPRERELLHATTTTAPAQLVGAVRTAVRAGHDPLGDAYCAVRCAADRRERGQTFTPGAVIAGMYGWAGRQGRAPARIVDPGAGSGRFTLEGLRRYPDATAVAVELDPAVALVLRANLVAAGLDRRATVVVGDFREVALPAVPGTLWIGNPPYVRHHGLGEKWKDWYVASLAHYGVRASRLAGLHLHFFVRTLQLATDDDLGCYVTAAEWLDVNYGDALRRLLTEHLGGRQVCVVDPAVRVFDDAMVSAAITCFAPHDRREELCLARVATGADLRELPRGETHSVQRLRSERSWSIVVRGGSSRTREGHVELGELFRVSRGLVTGLNRAWIESRASPGVPQTYLRAAITDSADITRAADAVIGTDAPLRRLVCLPRRLEDVPPEDRAAVARFLEWAHSLGAHETYIARHRNPWWFLGAKPPPPIVMTYMGRRPPVFALNTAEALLLNIAHGLYPRQAFEPERMRRLVRWLNGNVPVEQGRVYAGGLTKFEPSEAMRILVPLEFAS